MSVSPTLEQAQDAGFSLGGEPSVALDFVDTHLHAHADDATDLLEHRGDAWWGIEASRLPEGPAPLLAPAQRLRAAVRELIEARIDGRAPSAAAVTQVNRAAGAAHETPELTIGADGPSATIRWQGRHDGDAHLAVIARDAIALVADPVRSAQLRRCANPTCSMLFLAENPRRIWCAANVCGNRARVARHQRRQKEQG